MFDWIEFRGANKDKQISEYLVDDCVKSEIEYGTFLIPDTKS